MRTIYLSGITITLLLLACKNNNLPSDAFGNFQATEIIVSSESSGKIIVFDFEEGDIIEKGTIIVKTDSLQYSLKLQELKACRNAVKARKTSIFSQVDVYTQQLTILEKDRQRIQNLLNEKAATPKQLDDINGQISIIKKQIHAVESNLLGINAEVAAIDASIAQVLDLLARTSIKSPITGTLILKYAHMGEVTAPGKALFKLADLTKMELKAYISGSQLSKVNIGRQVTVLIDGQNGTLTEYPGKISWIASEAEFTPKNIQTREERLSQVYAIKVLVANNGAIKINMPGEVRF